MSGIFIPEQSVSEALSRLYGKILCRRLLYGNFLCGAFYFGSLHPENFRFASSHAGDFFCAKNITDQILTKAKRSVIRPLLFVGMTENKQKGNSNDIDSYHLSFNLNGAGFSARRADPRAGPGAVFETRFAVLRQKRGCRPTTADNGD